MVTADLTPAQGETQPRGGTLPLELVQDGAQLARAALVERADLLGGAGSQNELVAIKPFRSLAMRASRAPEPEFAPCTLPPC